MDKQAKYVKQVKEYYINNDGILEEVNDNKNILDEEKISLVKDDKTNEVFIKTNNNVKIEKTNLSVINKNELNINKELLKNPFLYDVDDIIKDQEITTIEDFYVCKGKNYYNFGALFRTKVLWYFTRKILIKKNLKKWNEEVEKRIEDFKLIGDTQFQTSKNKLVSKINIFPFIFSILTFICSILLINGKVWIIKSPEGLFKTITYASLALSIFVFLMSVLYNRRANFTRNLYSKNKNEFNKSKIDLEKEYKKRFKTTYRFYSSFGRRKMKKAPLLLSKTAIGEKQIRSVECLVGDSNKKIILSTKKENGLKVVRFLLMLISTSTCLYILGFAIYEIVMFYLKK